MYFIKQAIEVYMERSAVPFLEENVLAVSITKTNAKLVSSME
jgi:hypothetical protein